MTTNKEEIYKLLIKIAKNGSKTYEKLKKMNGLDGIELYYSSIINAKFIKELLDEKCKEIPELNDLMYLIQEELRIKEIVSELMTDIDSTNFIFKKKE